MTTDGSHEDLQPGEAQPTGAGRLRPEPGWAGVALGMVGSPHASLEQIRERRPWVGVVLAMGAVSVVVTPVFGILFGSDAFHGGGLAILAIAALMAPVNLAQSLLVQSGLLWVLVRIVAVRARFEAAVSLVANLSVVLSVGAVIGSLAVLVVARLAADADLVDSHGMLVAAVGSRAVWITVLVAIAAVGGWWVRLLALGSSIVFGLSERHGRAVAAMNLAVYAVPALAVMVMVAIASF